MGRSGFPRLRALRAFGLPPSLLSAHVEVQSCPQHVQEYVSPLISRATEGELSDARKHLAVSPQASLSLDE